MEEVHKMNTKKRHMVKVACYMIVLVNNKLLLMKRKNSGCDDGTYTVPSGHMESNETPLECAVRETMEEIGITVTESEFLSVMYRTNKNIGQQCSNPEIDYIDFFFVCRSYRGTVKNMEPDKCSEIIFVDINKLPENMSPHVSFALEHIKNNDHSLLIIHR